MKKSIYNLIIDGKELSTKNINDLGISKYDLKKLVDEGFLVRVKRGLYELGSVSGLTSYIFFSRKLNPSFKIELFNNILASNPECFKGWFYLFYINVGVSNFKGARDALSHLKDNDAYKNDYNFFIKCLGYLTNVSDENVDSFKSSDMLITQDDTRYNNPVSENAIRRAISTGNITLASGILEHQLGGMRLTVHSRLTKNLVCALQLRKNQVEHMLLSLARKYQFDKLLYFLENNKDEYILDKTKKYTIKLLYDLRDGKIVMSNKVESNYKDIFEALDNGDYTSAFSVAGKNSMLYHILDFANKNRYYVPGCDDIDEALWQLKEQIDKKNSIQVGCIIKTNLLYNQKLELYPLFMSLVELACNYPDSNCLENELWELNTDVNYQFNARWYLEQFRECVKNNCPKADGYLKVLECAIDLGLLGVNKSTLHFILDYKKYLNKEIKIEDSIYLKDLSDLEEKLRKDITKFHKTGVGLLRFSSLVQREMAYTVLVNDPRVYVRKTHNSQKNLIVKVYSDLEIDNNLLEEAKECLKNKNYSEALDKFLIYVRSINYVSANLLMTVSSIYFELGNYYRAKYYADIAKGMDTYRKISNEKRLGMESSIDDTISMYLGDYYYDIPNIDQIIYETLYNKLSISELVDKYEVELDDIPFIYLILAREFYYLNLPTMGDRMFNLASKYGCDDSEFKRFSLEIMKNKKFYANRIRNSFDDIVRLELKK